jgi:hypothetical protein
MDESSAPVSLIDEGCNQVNHPVEPHDNDVLCGRGGDINIHPGNMKFRKLVSTNKLVYLTCRFKREKRLIAERIVHEIQKQNPPGRFLTKDKINGHWFEISDEKARDKTSQALREGAPKIREQLHSELGKKDSPKPNNMDWMLRDQNSYIDVYETRDSPYHYDSRGPQRGNDVNYYNQHNILNTFRDRFGCPVNLNDVRDDDYSRDIDYDVHQEYDNHHEHYHYDQHTNSRAYPYHEDGWTQHHYDLPPDRIASQKQHMSTVNYNFNHHDHNMGIRSGNKEGNAMSDSVGNRPQARTSGIWQSLKTMLSWGSDGEFEDRQKHPETVKQGTPCKYPASLEQNGEKFTERSSEEVQSEKHWTNSFYPCHTFNPFQGCQPNFMDVANWNICGEHPETNITSIQSIEIDEPIPSGEMRGSSLVHVFDESSPNIENGNYDESALHDSSLNLIQLPSIDMNFSNDKDRSIDMKFSNSEMSL